MKVSIPVKKTVTETIELPHLPYYSQRYNSIFYMINEAQEVIYVSNRQIACWPSDNSYYGDSLLEACEGEPCTKEEFDKAISDTQETIKRFLNPAKGAVTNTMNTQFDPNEQKQQEEAVNEQVQATEQQAQEQALESAEEGSTEG